MSDIITIEGVSKTRRAWLTDLSLETQINYGSPTQAWRLDHNRSDTIHIDNPESSRRRKRLREGGGKKKRTAKKAPKKPPKSRKKEGVGTIEHDGAVWKWDYQRKEWMLANFGGTLKGKTKKKKAKKEPPKKKVASKPKVKSEREAVITHRSQVTPGPYGEALHDVWITVDGNHYYIPSVPGNTINRNKDRDSLRDLIKLSGTEKRERSMGSMFIKGSKSKSERGSLFDTSPKTFPYERKFGNKDYVILHRIPRKKLDSEKNTLKRLGIRANYAVDGDQYVVYVNKADKALREKQIVPTKPPKSIIDKFWKDDPSDPWKEGEGFVHKGMLMNASHDVGLIIEPKEVFKDLPTDPYKGRSSTYFNVDLPITAKANEMTLKEIKGKKEQGYEMIRIGNNVMEAKLVRDAVSVLGRKDIVFRAERKDYPIAIQNSKGTTLMVAPLVGMVGIGKTEQAKRIPRIEDIQGVESTSLTE